MASVNANRASPLDGVFPLNPFAHKVEEQEEPLTLFGIADKIANMSLADFRKLNPELDALPANEPVPVGTIVRCPTTVVQRDAAPLGPYFSLGEEERRMAQCYEKLDLLMRQVAEEKGVPHGGVSQSVPVPVCFTLPARSVLSKTERVMRVVHAEATRQLPHVQEQMKKPGRKLHHLKYMLDNTAVKSAMRAAEEEFTDAHVHLDCFAHTNCLPFDTLEESSALGPATIQPRVLDDESDFCMHHSHRWEFTFKSLTSTVDTETWAVLSCQKLTVLIDAFECLPSQFVSEGGFQNAFLFLGGVFYVDDRHAGEPGYEDLSVPIRSMDPLVVLASQNQAAALNHTGAAGGGEIAQAALTQGANLGFGHCPVMSASSTTFADLRVRLGEQGVIRHRGACDHYFTLASVRSLQGLTRTVRSSYPHRVMKQRDYPLRCALCAQFPSTIVLYGDECSATSPAAYCAMCYELLHKDDTAEEAARYVKVVAPPGQFFKRAS